MTQQSNVPAVERTSTSEAYTAALAAGLARVLKAGDVVGLSGPLGSGKTFFAAAVARALGVPAGAISSPTFVIVNQYATAPAPGRPARLVHVDAYRLQGTDELDPLGWDRLPGPPGGEPDAAMLVEWPERIEPALPRERATVTLEPTGATSRSIRIDLPASWALRAGVPELIERDVAVCPRSRQLVPPNAPAYPFANPRLRDADLFGWLTGAYRLSRPMEDDEDER